MAALPLIVTNTDDLHADALVAELRTRGCDHFRLNTNVMGKNATLSWELNDCAITEFGRVLDIAKVTSVIWRRPERAEFDELKQMPAQTVSAVGDDALLTVQGVLRASLDRCPIWISHPDNIRRAQFKPRQLRDASALGFCVPDTLVTNDPSRARDFIRKHKFRVAAKQAARGDKIGYFEGAVYTVNLSKHSPDYVEALLEGVRYCPTMFQSYIEKDYEIRATLFGARAVSAKICSQEHAASQDDWRKFVSEAGLSLKHERVELPGTILAKCTAMLAQYGLNFGCFDFVVTPDSDIVFLELNPNGQFMWLEYEIPGLGLVDAWADLAMGLGLPTYQQ
ncbi:MAG TPA: hypothetical protein VII56_13145 [Rhizomicrobium sp.]